MKTSDSGVHNLVEVCYLECPLNFCAVEPHVFQDIRSHKFKFKFHFPTHIEILMVASPHIFGNCRQIYYHALPWPDSELGIENEMSVGWETKDLVYAALCGMAYYNICREGRNRTCLILMRLSHQFCDRNCNWTYQVVAIRFLWHVGALNVLHTM